MPKKRKNGNTQSGAERPGSRLGVSPSAVEARVVEFIAEYRKNGGNGTAAAMAAGYSPASAHITASRLLRRADVKAKLEEIDRTVMREAKLSLANTLEQLRRNVEFDPRHLYDEQGNLLPPSQWPDDCASALTGVEMNEIYEGAGKSRRLVGYTKKVRHGDRMNAVEKAMRYFGAFEKDNNQRGESLSLQIAFVTPEKRRA